MGRVGKRKKKKVTEEVSSWCQEGENLFQSTQEYSKKRNGTDLTKQMWQCQLLAARVFAKKERKWFYLRNYRISEKEAKNRAERPHHWARGNRVKERKGP